jgi:hypothetical protein
MFIAEMAESMRQRIEQRHTRIPGTEYQTFLYLEDFHTLTWGSFLGVPLILNAFVYLAINGQITFNWWIVFALLVVADLYSVHEMCTAKNRRPGWRRAKTGKISFGGLLYMPYRAICLSASMFLMIYALFAEYWQGPAFKLAAVGAVIFLCSVVVDVVAGNFDPLQTEEEAKLITPKRLQTIAERMDMPYEEWDIDAPVVEKPKDTCLTCNVQFSEENPHAGGGVCQKCWAVSH